jgi:uncharacterized protein YkwD
VHARIFLALLLLGSTSLINVPAAHAQSSCKGASADPRLGSLDEIEHTTLCLINSERRSHGRRGLRSNRLLHLAARRHSRDMVRDHFYAHTSPSGQTFDDRIRQAGYLRGARSWFLGENIAWGKGTYATPRAIVRAWMNSPPHRHSILSSSFRSVGVGVAAGTPRSGGRGATYTTDFGSRT